MRFSRRPGRATLAAGGSAALVLALASGCTDAPEPLAPPLIPTAPNLTQGTPPGQASVTLGLPNPLNTAHAAVVLGDSLTRLTRVRVRVEGKIFSYKNFPDSMAGQLNKTYLPKGLSNSGGTYGNVVVQFKATGYTATFDLAGFPATDPVEFTVNVRGQARAFRGSSGKAIEGYAQQPLCTQDGTGTACVYYEGSQTVTITPSASTLQLTASPSSATVGDSVTFSAQTSNGSAWTVEQWSWVPDSGETNTGTCTNSEKSCKVAVRQSGTMYVTGIVAGNVAEMASVQVTATEVPISLQVSHASPAAGSAAEFTATSATGDPVEIQQWVWIPSGSATPSASCAAETNPCITNPTSSGTMHVYGRVRGGAIQHASANVTVDLCYTGDPRFDHAKFREGLGELWTASMAGMVESSGNLYYRLSTGTYEWTYANLATANQCTVDPDDPIQNDADLVPIGQVHTHIASKGNSITCNYANGRVETIQARGRPSDGDLDWMEHYRDDLGLTNFLSMVLDPQRLQVLDHSSLGSDNQFSMADERLANMLSFPWNPWQCH